MKQLGIMNKTVHIHSTRKPIPNSLEQCGIAGTDMAPIDVEGNSESENSVLFGQNGTIFEANNSDTYGHLPTVSAAWSTLNGSSWNALDIAQFELFLPKT
jgi:hypothetical protein